MKTLADLGFNIITPDSGYLACGYTGKGRLPEPERLVEEVKRKLSKKDLKNKKVVITAGPTRESLDPVRFLSNYSSGKMGYALAKAASYRGAEVKLISGPSAVEVPLGVELAQIETAEEMKEAVFAEYKNADLVIMAAAVSDYRPQEIMTEKIKKSGENLVLKLERTTDILAELGKNKKNSQLLVGFAAESENLLENAQKKLSKKQADYIIANDISNQSIGFGSDKNQVSILSKEGIVKLPTADKEKLAHQILNYILSGQKNQG
jgi:phosphopantothenoylcysteine decarboxylase/phosphopantothenate--cysteine ligase